MIKVEFCNEFENRLFPAENGLCVEDCVKSISQKLGIRPLCQHLYSLRNCNTRLWPSLSRKLSELSTSYSYQFRIRFKINSTENLKKIDYASYTYLFHQVRHDFKAGRIPELTEQPKDGLGLVVTDILHYLISHPDKRVSDLEIKNFLPRCLDSYPNRHNVLKTTKKLYEANSEKFFSRGCDYIRNEYLEQVDLIGRSGSYEKYAVEVDEGFNCFHADLFIDPFNPEYPSIYYQTGKKVIHHICRIEELVFVSIRKQDLTVELSRANGVPCYFSFTSNDFLESFVGCISGYYRLMKTWSFDLCSELATPSLVYLRSNKCHGPVGIEFVGKKLKSKGSEETGVGILRQSSRQYDVYKLNILKNADHPSTELVILETDNKLHFKDSEVMHDTLHDLIRWTINSQYKDCGLRRLLPPSDLDIADQLLICSENKVGSTAVKTSGPRILNMEHFIVKNKIPLHGRFSNVYHVLWTAEGNEELAVKVPKFQNYEKDEFLQMLNKFLFIEGDCVVKVIGMTLSPLSLVMEFLPLGPLDKYLEKNSDKMLQVDLVEAASYLAKALWDLHSKGITHHGIRCHNILVAEHTDQRFKVKLGDPGKSEYSLQDIHWLPREHLLHPPSAFTDPSADIWAFATTVWQIFSYGAKPLPDADLLELRDLYMNGFMLPRPDACPKDLYHIILCCWHPDPHSRKHPQAIMRDIKQIFYYIFNSRRENQYTKLHVAYAEVNPEKQADSDNEDENDTSFVSDLSNMSVSTQITTITQTDGSLTEVTLKQISNMDYPLIPPEVAMSNWVSTYSLPSPTKKKTLTLKELLVRPIWNSQNLDASSPSTPLELNNCSIEILKRIGKGNYGYVFIGKMTYIDHRKEYVALKRLQSVGNTSDFKKEMDIMKNLIHENIVFLHGLVESDQEGCHLQYMVMEYLSLGSLQDYLLSNKDDNNLTSDKRLLAFSLDIAKGMDYLESQHIIHRDLAARNVLVASEDHVKITDFGLAQRPNQGNYYIVRTVREMPIRWYALESIEHGKFSHKSDVWSYGVTIWEMFTRGLTPDLPNDGSQLIQALKNGTRLVCKGPCQPSIYSKLIRPCWDQEPPARPDFARIISVITEIQEEYI